MRKEVDMTRIIDVAIIASAAVCISKLDTTSPIRLIGATVISITVAIMMMQVVMDITDNSDI